MNATTTSNDITKDGLTTTTLEDDRPPRTIVLSNDSIFDGERSDDQERYYNRRFRCLLVTIIAVSALVLCGALSVIVIVTTKQQEQNVVVVDRTSSDITTIEDLTPKLGSSNVSPNTTATSVASTIAPSSSALATFLPTKTRTTSSPSTTSAAAIPRSPTSQPSTTVSVTSMPSATSEITVTPTAPSQSNLPTSSATFVPPPTQTPSSNNDIPTTSPSSFASSSPPSATATSSIATTAPSLTDTSATVPPATLTSTPPTTSTAVEQVVDEDDDAPVNPVRAYRGYFNYDLNDRNYGPTNWHNVDTRWHWLGEFGPFGWGIWKNHIWDENPTNNLCRSRSNQSPIDIQSSSSTTTTTSPDNPFVMLECDAHHEIRTQCGQYRLSDDVGFQKVIYPHKLSIITKRRDCKDDIIDSAFIDDNNNDNNMTIINQCLNDGRPPMIDLPRFTSAGGAQFSDLHHLDIKVPSEHTIDGQRFDGEIQLFHIHLVEDKLSSISILIDATDDGYNWEYQAILDEFQKVYDNHTMECNEIRRQQQQQPVRQRNLLRRSNPTKRETNERGSSCPTNVSTSHGYHGQTKSRDQEAQQESRNRQRNLNAYISELPENNWRFNPYSDAFMTSMFFYRYEGSITEPPCKAVTWWVMDKPMTISKAQLRKTKNLLFTHVTPQCFPTSVHNSQQSVARPIQFSFAEGGGGGGDSSNSLFLQHCQEGDFTSDIEKGRPPGRRCRNA